jgi:hypothetical protein
MTQGSPLQNDAPQDPAVTAAIARIAVMSETEPPPGGLEAAESWGSYTGLPARIALLDDGRMAELLAPISYRDPDGLSWDVPEGSKLDGASIPRAFWTLIGGPFEGRYRDASIVHDRYCDDHRRAWKATHRMFHSAMRCSGVGALMAKLMYYAVYRFGPRWPDPGGQEVVAPAPERLTAANAESLVVDAEAILARDPSLDEIDRLADAHAAGGAPGNA